MSVTSNILQRTFRIGHGDSTGTCFTVDMDNRRYLVTARHVVETISDGGIVRIEHGGEWKSVPVDLVGHGKDDVDISVLSPHAIFGGQHPLAVKSADLQLAEEVYFLGFPYGIGFDAGEINDGFPMPLVKRAIVSALPPRPEPLLLDGHNNPGFSGGPVVRRWREGVQAVVGVVSAFSSENPKVIDEAGNPGPYSYSVNTGIVHAFNSLEVKEIIAAHPIGIALDQFDGDQ